MRDPKPPSPAALQEAQHALDRAAQRILRERLAAKPEQPDTKQ